MYNLQTKLITALGIVFVLFLQVAWFAGLIDYTDYIYIFAPFLCIVFCIELLKRLTMRSPKFYSFLLVTTGLLFFAVAEVVYVYLALFAGIDPFPSVADALFVAAPILISMGIIREVAADLSLVSKWRLLGFFVVSIAVMWYMISRVFDPMGTVTENIVYVGYVFGDGLLLLSALLALSSTFTIQKGRFGKIWLYFSIAAFLYMVGDFVYVQFADLYEIQSNWAVMQIDVLWVLSYLFFALGIAKMTQIIDDVSQRIKG